MAYVIDMQTSPAKLVACSIHASVAAPGMYLCVFENGKSLCVEPDGSHVRDIDGGADNWDSPWTQASLFGDKLVYRSSGGQPRGYLVIR